MTFTRSFTMCVVAAAAAICSMPTAAQSTGLTPASPSLTMSFLIEDNVGKVQGTLTAPSKDSGYEALPEGTTMNLRVVRSSYSLGEENISVASFEGVTPGETLTFFDTAEPAWQYGVSYTYNAYASIGENQCAWPGYGSMTPGISFSFGYNTASATPALDGKSVTLSAVMPTKDSANKDIPVDFTALEVYRVIDRDTYPFKTELIESLPSPAKGATVTYVDNNPVENASNYYVLRAVTPFGFAEITVNCYVGKDIPVGPYPVAAKPYQGGIRVYWTAPDRGINWGAIDPEKTVYNVFRCWGAGADNRMLIAERIKETEFIDYGTDMDKPRAVRYEVQSANDMGDGQSNYSSFDYDLIVGPSQNLPFVETFDDGTDNVWVFENSAYRAPMYIGTEAEYGSNTVQPYEGTGLIYVDYTGYGVPTGATNTMTSYKIDLSKAVNPALSFHYYAIPDNDVTIDLLVSTDGTEFTSLLKTVIAKDVTEAEWRRAVASLADYAGKETVYVRFVTSFEETPASAILDSIVITDYKGVGTLEAEGDSERRMAIITWADPSTEYAKCTGFKGYVNDVEVGAVTSPWEYEVAEYGQLYVFRVEALYDGVTAPLSAPAGVTVAAPAETEFTEGDYIYAVNLDTPDGVHEIYVKKYIGTRGGLMQLPERVNHNNVSYAVTRVLEGAFRERADILSIAIPDTYTAIETEAFADCTGLMGITFGTGITEIGARAFAGCSALTTVIFKSTVPPAVAEDAFTGIAEGCRGTCPDTAVNAYEAVKGLDPVSFAHMGIADIIAAGDADVEYFDLNGIRIERPVPGTCVIVRATSRDGQVTVARVYVK